MRLQGKTVALLISPEGTEDVEFTKPKQALTDEGAKVVVISTKPDNATTVEGDLSPKGSLSVDLTFMDANTDDFDAVVIPGGTVGADTLRREEDVVTFVRRFFEQGKPVAAICHAPWLIVEADEARGRTLTSFPSIKTDIRNAGGTWVDQEVVVDNGVVTSRNPDDLPAFCAAVIDIIAGE